MMMMVMIITIIKVVVAAAVVVVFALKGAIREVLQSPHYAANCPQQGATVCKSRATHGALITCYMSCAT